MLSDLAVVFTGVEPAPTSIATFFPEVLQQLTIYTPIDADDAEQQAVLTLASAVARNYRPQTPTITVVSQPRRAFIGRLPTARIRPTMTTSSPRRRSAKREVRRASR